MDVPLLLDRNMENENLITFTMIFWLILNKDEKSQSDNMMNDNIV